jgi:aquaporin Z
MHDMKKYLAELLGTFVMGFIKAASAVAGEQIVFLGIALAIGITVFVMVYAIGQISGCQINPSICNSGLPFKHYKKKQSEKYLTPVTFSGLLPGNPR